MNRGHYFFCVWSIAIVGAVPSFAVEATDGNSEVTVSETKDSAYAQIVPKIALNHAARGEYDAALPYCRDAVSNNPQSGAAHECLGLLLLGMKEADEAIAELNKAVQLDPSNVDFHKNLGVAFATQGDREQALRHLGRAIQLAPGNPEPLFELGKYHYVTGGFSKSADVLGKLLAIDASVETRLIRASAYRRCQKFSEAIEDCDEVLKVSPDDHNALTCRAFSRMRSGDLEGARQDAKRAIAAREATANVGYLVRGCVRYSRKEFDAALGDLSMAIDLAPQEPLAYVMRAVVHFSQSRTNDAMSDLDDAIKLSSNPQRLNYELDGFGYQVYKFRGFLRTGYARQHKEAIEDLNQAIELNGKDTECFTLRGIANLSDLNSNSALADFEKAVEVRQDDDLATFMLVNILIGSPDDKLRDGKRAIELAEGLNDRRPNEPVILRSLAGAHSEASEFEKAKELQSQVLEQLESASPTSSFSTSIWWRCTYNFLFTPKREPNQELLELYQQKKPFRLAGKRSATESTISP
jgi:tetratricopeptide (TPR) repeat protein